MIASRKRNVIVAVILLVLIIVVSAALVSAQNENSKQTEEQVQSLTEVTEIVVAEEEVQVERIEQKPEQPTEKGINWPSVFPGGSVDVDADGIDDRYKYRVSRDGRPVTDTWVYKIHPHVGRIAFPVDSQKGIYRGGRPPLVRNLPDFGPNQRWIHVPLGSWDGQYFDHYTGLQLKSGIQIAWVVVEDGSRVPPDSPLLPEMVELAPRG